MSIFDVLTPAINKVLDLIPDPKQKIEAEQHLMSGLQAWDAQQTSVNIEEAKSEHLFVAGWRPFIGWVCGVAFAYHFVLQPLLAFVLANAGVDVKLPIFKMEELSTVLMGMLGLGGLRSYEKIKGV
jgi:Trk-type K+ transport system membrane component